MRQGGWWSRDLGRGPVPCRTGLGRLRSPVLSRPSEVRRWVRPVCHLRACHRRRQCGTGSRPALGSPAVEAPTCIPMLPSLGPKPLVSTPDPGGTLDHQRRPRVGVGCKGGAKGRVPTLVPYHPWSPSVRGVRNDPTQVPPGGRRGRVGGRRDGAGNRGDDSSLSPF